MRQFAKQCKSFFKTHNSHLIWRLDKSGPGAFNIEKNIVYGGDLKNPTHKQSFGCLLFSRMTRPERKNDVFQINARTKEQMTMKECLQKSVAFAIRLQEENVKKGDYVILVGANSLNMNVSLIGTFFLGAIPFPLSNKVNLKEFRKILKLLKPKYFGCDEKYFFYFKKALADSSDCDPTKIFIINQSNLPDKSKTSVLLDDFIKGREENFEYFQPAQVDDPKENLALLIRVSSEKTDERIIGITHYNINSVIARYDAKESYRNFKDEVILMVQKNIWMSGLYCLFLSCCHGSKLIVMSKFDEESFLKAVDEFKVTTTFLYYARCWQLVKFVSNNRFDLSSCKHFYSIDGFLSNFFTTKLKEKFGVPPKNLYGFPEFSGAVLENSGNVKRSSGKLVPQSFGKIISDATSKYAGPHERGELCFKGPTICKGYINDEKRFKDSFDSEGYFLSGHYGYYDEDGDFFIIDCIANQIKYKDYKILPKELESIIKSLDSVKDVCVAGLKHETDGEHPFAFVSLQKGQTVTAQEILNYVNERVPEYKRIRGVIFIPKMLRNKESGKINRVLFRKILSKFRIKALPPEAIKDLHKISEAEQKKELMNSFTQKSREKVPLDVIEKTCSFSYNLLQ